MRQRDDMGIRNFSKWNVGWTREGSLSIAMEHALNYINFCFTRRHLSLNIASIYMHLTYLTENGDVIYFVAVGQRPNKSIAQTRFAHSSLSFIFLNSAQANNSDIDI